MSRILTTALLQVRGPACFDADYGTATTHQLDPRNDGDADQWMDADLDGMPVSVSWGSNGSAAFIDGFVVGDFSEEKHYINARFVAPFVLSAWQEKAQQELRDLLNRAYDDAQEGRFAA